MRAHFTLLTFCLFFIACQKPVPITYRAIDFQQVHWYAERAQLAYQSEAEIRQALPNVVWVATTQRDVQYFLERDTVLQQQIISVRGTANLRNAREDAEYVESRNPKLGIYVHDGFDEDATQIFQAILPQLDRSQTVLITGHSLGAAIATLLMMYLHEEGFEVGPSINFGQPKLTNHTGVEKYQFLPLLRVVDENDLVPLVPPDDLVDAVHGGYEHLGAQLTLLEGRYYAYLEQPSAEKASLLSFWKNLGHESIPQHFMRHYLDNIVNKLAAAQQIPYRDRERFIQKK